MMMMMMMMDMFPTHYFLKTESRNKFTATTKIKNALSCLCDNQ